MKKLTIAALLVGGAILASPSAFASATANNLYVGFQAGTNASADYIINLGVVSNTITGSSSVVDLSTNFSLSNFNSITNTSSSVYGGVVAVYQGIVPDAYATQLRSALGTPAVPGSTAPLPISRSALNGAAGGVLGGLNGPAAGTGVLDAGKSWQAAVEPGGTSPNSFFGSTGVNPDTIIAPGSVVYEDLWTVSNGTLGDVASWTYLGYFTLDLSGGSPKLTFTPTNAPATLVPPVIVSVTKAGSTVTLISSNAVATYSYQLQSTASLNPTSWVNVGSSQVATTTLVTNTDTSAPATNRFYRVKAQ